MKPILTTQAPFLYGRCMTKQFFLLCLVSSVCCLLHAQALSGTKLITNTGNGDYLSPYDAAQDCISKGIANGGVIFNVPAGESFVDGMYFPVAFPSSADKPVTFRKFGNGANPIIYVSGVSNPTTQGGYYVGDAGIFIDRADYLTFDGLDIRTMPVPAFPQEKLEFGFILYKTNTNACEHITIRNCGITLDRSQDKTVGIYAPESDWDTHSSLQPQPGGAHNYLSIENNHISGAENGILLGASTGSQMSNPDKNITINGNVIDQMNARYNFCTGISVPHSDSLIISNCSISTDEIGRHGTHAILLSNTAGTVSIFNDTISVQDSVETIGISLQYYSTQGTAEVHHNVLTNCLFMYKAPFQNGASGVGIQAWATIPRLFIHHNIVTENYFERQMGFLGRSAAIQIIGNGTKAYVENNTISGNHLHYSIGEFYGINAYGKYDSMFVSSNSITNQFIYEDGINSAGFYGIGGNEPALNTVFDTSVHVYENNLIEQQDTGRYLLGISNRNIRHCIIRGNTVRNFVTSNTACGISVNNDNANLGIETTISGNSIYNMKGNGELANGNITGISVFSSNTAHNSFAYSITNNMISGFSNYATEAYGIRASVMLQPVNILHNTVNLKASDISNDELCAGMYLYGSSTAKNTLLSNNILRVTGTVTGTQKCVALILPMCEQILDSASNYNNFYVSPIDTFHFVGGGSCFGSLDSLLPDLNALKTHLDYSNNSSISTNVVFVNNDTDLHLSGASVTNAALKKPRAIVLTDFDGETRPVQTFIGADEPAQPTTTEEVSADNIQWVLYPNPVNDIMNIHAGQTVSQLSVLDLQGRVIFTEENLSAETVSVSTSQLEAGTYFCVVKTENGTAVRKFIKQ